MRALSTFVAMLGEVVRLVPRFVIRRAKVRSAEVFEVLAESSSRALTIVAVVNILTGAILAFVGAVQLSRFGAGIYVADLVGTHRCGVDPDSHRDRARRTYLPSFAARIATMQGNEEIDALTTLGVSPIEFLVVPRVIALTLLMPLLYVYGCTFAILGGMGLSADTRSFVDCVLGRTAWPSAVVRTLPSADSRRPCLARLSRCWDVTTDYRPIAVPRAWATPRPTQWWLPSSALLRSTRSSQCAQTRLASEVMDARAGSCITIDNVTVGYGTQPVQSGISARIENGEIFAIVGDSGSGKSTLMKTMAGLIQPQSGRILFDGHTLEACMQDGPPLFGILFQSSALWSSMTVLENVTLPMDLQSYPVATARAELARFKLALVGLAGDEHRYPASLSGGMRKRAALARALALDPAILFLDEPSAGLDPLTSRRLDELVLSLRDGLGITVVLVTHELESLYSIADRMIFLDGETHRPEAIGSPAELARSADSRKVRDFLHGGQGCRLSTLRLSDETAQCDLIGVFVLGALALIAAAILFFGSGTLFKQRFTAVSYFPDQ